MPRAETNYFAIANEKARDSAAVFIRLKLVNDHRLKPVASGYGWKPD
jgi:hypothetical protein